MALHLLGAINMIEALDLEVNGSCFLDEQKKSLLMIEDDLSLIELLDIVIDEINPGLDWEYVTTGEEALKVIERRAQIRGAPYTLVLADIFLAGELTGFDVWLFCQRKFPQMPFVFTSSLSADRFLSIISGLSQCPEYIQKPLTVSHCMNLIRSYF